jgi:hypothetical protein
VAAVDEADRLAAEAHHHAAASDEAPLLEVVGAAPWAWASCTAELAGNAAITAAETTYCIAHRRQFLTLSG